MELKITKMGEWLGLFCCNKPLIPDPIFGGTSAQERYQMFADVTIHSDDLEACARLLQKSLWL